MVSSSLRKSHKRTIPLDSLPEDVLGEISLCIAASSLSSVRNLRLVSKPFRHICDEQYILCRLSLRELPFSPWFHNPKRFSNFFKRCRRNGNPEALYREGLIKYFLDNQKQKGLKFLAEAAEKGNQEATYVYGMILICLGVWSGPEHRTLENIGPVMLGCNTKQKGFKILSSLVKPLMSKTMKELVELREKIRDRLWWRGRPVMKQLKTAHVREKCECDGRTKMFLVKNCAWHRYGEDNDMNTSSSCEFCLWHHEFELLFHNIE